MVLFTVCCPNQRRESRLPQSRLPNQLQILIYIEPLKSRAIFLLICDLSRPEVKNYSSYSMVSPAFDSHFIIRKVFKKVRHPPLRRLAMTTQGRHQLDFIQKHRKEVPKLLGNLQPLLKPKRFNLCHNF